MAPRRGGSSYYSYYDSSPWSETTILSLDYGYYGYGYNHSDYRTLFIARFAFEILSLLALIVFLIWSCTIRNRGLPLKGLISALVSLSLSQVCTIIWQALYIANAEVMEYYRIVLMLSSFFGLLGTCLTFYVFWSLLHRLLGRLTDSGKPYAAITIIHWVLLGLIVLLSIVDWGLYVTWIVSLVTDFYNPTELAWTKLEAALYIVFWLLSLEIVAWSIFVLVKAGNHRFVSKMPANALISAAIGWFAFCLTWAVIYIRYSLSGLVVAPDYLYTAKAVVQLIFWIVTFTGILLCCSKWSHLGEEPDKSVPVQYPYPQYPPGQYQYPPGQYPPGQYQYPYPNQPQGTAPYHDSSAQPQNQHQQVQRDVSPQETQAEARS